MVRFNASTEGDWENLAPTWDALCSNCNAVSLTVLEDWHCPAFGDAPCDPTHDQAYYGSPLLDRLVEDQPSQPLYLVEAQ